MHSVASKGNAGKSTSDEEKRFTYTFNEDVKKHSAAIKCLAVLKSSSPDGCDYLFTGSRDGTLKRYALVEGGATYSATFDSHLDWVNDAVLTGGNTLVSGSSDTTVKVWNCLSDGSCIRTLKKHSDYVTCLAAAKKENNVVASGGLGGEVFIWDIEAAVAPVSMSSDTTEDDSSNSVNGSGSSLPVNTGQSTSSSNAISSHTAQSQGYVPLAAKGHKDSVYAMAMNETGTVLVSGGTEKVVRVWDPRTGSKTMKLRGHTDNVRALLLDSTGRYCLSGSSDSMIRLWDLGQQRCVHSYAVHADSVWALASTPTFSHVYSGGRDLSLYLTDLATRETVLLCTNEHPILQLVLHDDDIWVATTDSSLKKWPSEGHNPEKVFQRGSSFLAGNLSSSRARVSLEGSTPVPVHGEPSYSIPGNSKIVQHEILNNQIHVLTEDIAGTVKLWQITNGSVIENYGKVPFEEKKKELLEKVSVPAWFTMDNHRFGSLSIQLDTPECFCAEMYSADLSIAGKPEDHKVNLARETLKGLFFHYLTKRKHRIEKERIEKQRVEEESTEEESIEERSTEELSMEKQSIESQASENGVLLCAKDRSNKALPLSKVEVDGNAGNCTVYPPFEFSVASTLSIIAKGSEGGMWKKNPKDLDGTEDEKIVPDWVLDCVLYNRLPAGEYTKCYFLLRPCEGSTVQITQAKLSGPCILRIQKVINHVIGKMVFDKSLDEMTSGGSFTPGLPGRQLHPPAAAADGSMRSGLQPRQIRRPSIEILCNNQVLPPEMNLSTVRAYIWEKSEDLVLHYRVVRAR